MQHSRRRTANFAAICAALAGLSTAATARAQAPAAGGGTPLRVAMTPGYGVTISSLDDAFALSLRGRIQLREGLTVPAAGAVSNELYIRTARVTLAGHVFSLNIQYQLQLAFAPADFEPGAVSPVYDAFVSLTHLRDLSVRAGQYFVPFDRLRTALESSLQLVDRAPLVGELALDRDVGVTVYSRDFLGLHGLLAYDLGVFSGAGKNRVTAPLGLLYVARLQVAPFGGDGWDVEGDLSRDPRPRLAVGIAGALHDNATRQRSTTGSVFSLGGYDYFHAAADITLKWAGFSLVAEGMYRQVLSTPTHRTGTQSGASVTEWSRSGWGYVFQAGAMLGRFVEITARWSQLLALGVTDPALTTLVAQQGHELGGGANVYFYAHRLKIQGDYFYLFGDDVRAGRHQLRVQAQLAF